MDQVAMGSMPAFQADQPVLHSGRRAAFLRMSRRTAIIRYWGDSHAVAVSPETLSPLVAKPRRPLAARDEPLAREIAAHKTAT